MRRGRPFARRRAAAAAAPAAAPGVEHRLRRDRQRLVRESVGLDAHTPFRRHVEHPHLRLGDVLLARHGVAVRLEGRTRVRERVDDPQVLHLAGVAPHRREPARVLRPADLDGRHARVLVLAVPLRRVVLLLLGVVLLLLLLLLLQSAGAHLARPAVKLLAVLRELRLDDGGIVGLLLRLGVVVGVRHVQIVAAREDDGLAVGREGGPARVARRRLVVLDERELRRGHVVLEVQRLVPRLRRAAAAGAAPALPLLRVVPVAHHVALVVEHVEVAPLGAPLLRRRDLLRRRVQHGVARHLEVELERGVVPDEVHRRERQVLRIIGQACHRRERGGHLRVVEQRALRLLQRIDQVEPPPVAGLVGVPEPIARLEPPRRHGGVEYELRYFLGRPLRREIVVGRRRIRARAGLGAGGHLNERQGRQRRGSGHDPGAAQRDGVGRHGASPRGESGRTRGQ